MFPFCNLFKVHYNACQGYASAKYHVYKHYKGFVYFNYTYKLRFIALFDDFNLIISILQNNST
jgi:hypothetical protein